MSLNDIVIRVKNALAQVSNISAFLTDLIVVSEFWCKGSTAHLVVWIPDIDAQTHRPKYIKKHIAYDVEVDSIELIERCKDDEFKDREACA